MTLNNSSICNLHTSRVHSALLCIYFALVRQVGHFQQPIAMPYWLGFPPISGGKRSRMEPYADALLSLFSRWPVALLLRLISSHIPSRPIIWQGRVLKFRYVFLRSTSTSRMDYGYMAVDDRQKWIFLGSLILYKGHRFCRSIVQRGLCLLEGLRNYGPDDQVDNHVWLYMKAST